MANAEDSNHRGRRTASIEFPRPSRPVSWFELTSVRTKRQRQKRDRISSRVQMSLLVIFLILSVTVRTLPHIPSLNRRKAAIPSYESGKRDVCAAMLIGNQCSEGPNMCRMST
ncbi:hypothetical protein BJY00DRAFT_284122 [Aspergillus carlsbadensis]|nr:hypothetical protein BJY00DRAFT_284122 [Aspergillus carlsbadensis]